MICAILCYIALIFTIRCRKTSCPAAGSYWLTPRPVGARPFSFDRLSGSWARTLFAPDVLQIAELEEPPMDTSFGVLGHLPCNIQIYPQSTFFRPPSGNDQVERHQKRSQLIDPIRSAQAAQSTHGPMEMIHGLQPIAKDHDHPRPPNTRLMVD